MAALLGRWEQLALLAGVTALPAWGQAPGLTWATNLGARVFAVDAQTNVYASASNNVIMLSAAGVPLQTNTICPLPGLAQRDAAGDFYFAGSFDGTNDFGGVTLVGGWIDSMNYPPPGKWSPGSPTCFLAKYGNTGSLQWVVSFGAQGVENWVSDLAVNADGSATVGFSNHQSIQLCQYSATGTNLWERTVGTGPAVKISGLTGTNGCYLVYNGRVETGGFYDDAGNLTAFSSSGPVIWMDPLSWNGKPVAGPTNSAYWAGLPWPSYLPTLQKSLAGGSVGWTQSLGTVEQWVLAGDHGGNLFLAGTDGIFSKYDGDGTLLWSTNYGAPAVALLVDSQDNRFASFLDGSIARLAVDAPPQWPVISRGPQSQTVFRGDNASLLVAASGTPPLRYAWRLNGTNLPGATSAALNLSNATPSLAGLYSVVVTNVAGAVTSAPAVLRVKSVALYAGGQLLTNGTYVFANTPTMTVRSAFPSGSAFYTLDGSAPSFTSTLYVGPFALSQSATVRAIGYSADFFQSEEADAVDAVVLARHRLAASASGGGSVILDPPGGDYLSTNTVIVTAVPSAGYTFLYWLGDAAESNPVARISMERDKAIRAVFGTSLSTTVAGNGQVRLDPPGGVYPYGSVVRLTAVPGPGSYFGAWGNAATGNTNPLGFTIAGPSPTVSAVFGATPSDQAALTVVLNGNGRVNVSPSANVYALNQSVMLTALPGPGQSFLAWSGDADGTQNPLAASMTHSKVITAHFTSRPLLRVDRPGLEGTTPAGFRLTLVGDPPSACEILASTDLSVWESVGWVTNLFGEVQFTDPAPAGAALRFYRAGP